jgi:hypothetical protein
VKLTTHLQLVPRSRKCGSIYPLPHTPGVIIRRQLLFRFCNVATFLIRNSYFPHEGVSFNLLCCAIANAVSRLDIFYRLWNPMDHYRVQKSPPVNPILDQLNRFFYILVVLDPFQYYPSIYAHVSQVHLPFRLSYYKPLL